MVPSEQISSPHLGSEIQSCFRDKFEFILVLVCDNIAHLTPLHALPQPRPNPSCSAAPLSFFLIPCSHSGRAQNELKVATPSTTGNPGQQVKNPVQKTASEDEKGLEGRPPGAADKQAVLNTTVSAMTYPAVCVCSGFRVPGDGFLGYFHS